MAGFLRLCQTTLASLREEQGRPRSMITKNTIRIRRMVEYWQGSKEHGNSLIPPMAFSRRPQHWHLRFSVPGIRRSTLAGQSASLGDVHRCYGLYRGIHMNQRDHNIGTRATLRLYKHWTWPLSGGTEQPNTQGSSMMKLAWLLVLLPTALGRIVSRDSASSTCKHLEAIYPDLTFIPLSPGYIKANTGMSSFQIAYLFASPRRPML